MPDITLADLWLPILVSAVAVWFAAALAWTILPHHKGDFKPLPNEDAAMSAVRNLAIPPGVYFFPHMKDCNKAKMDPVAREKFEKGPHGLLQVWPPDRFGKMGRNMILLFIFYIVVGVFIAYLATLASGGLPRGSEFMQVFQFTGTAGIMAYCFGSIPIDICFGKPLRSILACLADGVAYGLITGAIFGAMWPGAL
jgi:hypothetical protein